jgi:hypothetical protein
MNLSFSPATSETKSPILWTAVFKKKLTAFCNIFRAFRSWVGEHWKNCIICVIKENILRKAEYHWTALMLHSDGRYND